MIYKPGPRVVLFAFMVARRGGHIAPGSMSRKVIVYVCVEGCVGNM